jgi:hypothetical protein
MTNTHQFRFRVRRSREVVELTDRGYVVSPEQEEHDSRWPTSAMHGSTEPPELPRRRSREGESASVTERARADRERRGKCGRLREARRRWEIF